MRSGHRKPPMPASFLRRPRLKGVCRWCDKPVLNAKGEATKGTWHPECVTAYKLIAWPADTRAAVWGRDQGICARCGLDAERQWKRWNKANRIITFTYWRKSSVKERHAVRLIQAAESRLARMGKGWKAGAWQHDHIRPLIEANGELSFWQLDNIQTLCGGCHVLKGREDNRRRKFIRAPMVQGELLAL